jgi:hypothetical protein
VDRSSTSSCKELIDSPANDFAPAQSESIRCGLVHRDIPAVVIGHQDDIDGRQGGFLEDAAGAPLMKVGGSIRHINALVFGDVRV